MNIRSFAVAMVMTMFVTASAPAHASKAPAAGDPAPPYIGKSPEGNALSVKDYAGKILVVSFWATWCAPCRAELPILEGIQAAGKGHIQVVAVNIESDSVFRRAYKVLNVMTLQLANDANERAFDSYRVKGIPLMVIIGRDGRIVSVHSGYGEGRIPEIVEDVNRALTAAQNEQTATPE